MPTLKLWRALKADERGSAVVEFALVAPVFLLIVFGMLDFTRAYYTQSALAAAAREGVRAAAVQKDPRAAASQALVKMRVKNFVTPFGNSPIDTSKVSIQMLNGNGTDCTDPDATKCESVRVRITGFNFRYFTPISRIVNGGSNTRAVTREAILRFERYWAPPT